MVSAHRENYIPAHKDGENFFRSLIKYYHDCQGQIKWQRKWM